MSHFYYWPPVVSAILIDFLSKKIEPSPSAQMFMSIFTEKFTTHIVNKFKEHTTHFDAPFIFTQQRD